MQKRSRQREAILTFLQQRKDHPTADMIFQGVKDAIPNLSPGTVYRNLKLLEEAGTIQRISIGDSADHYDGNSSPHYHFYCKKCGSLTDFPMPVLSDLNVLAAHRFSGSIDGHSVHFYGICPKCMPSSDKEDSFIQE